MNRKGTQSGPDLWGNVVAPPTPKRTQSQEQPIRLDSQECVRYGHTWQLAGMDKRRHCTVCQVYAYCPICTPHYPKGANLIFCHEHRPQERRP
jgi:hypothetical protein